ncbi:protease inhibitor I42 family protein [Streptomyces thermolineatus]|uniref:protease inhibitor I42 family protein n=1 Tax=Streptomyces thermolineatus TaxID=44033 RepID=UPI00384B572E
MARIRIPSARAAVVPLAVLALLSTVSCAGGPDRGEVFSSDRTPVKVEVEAGEHFSLAVRESASAGDDWSVAAPGPDTSVAVEAGTDYEADPGTEDMDGAGGTRYFTFEAKAPGRTEIVLRNCWRGACNGTGPSASPSPTGGQPEADVPTVSYEVTVR